MDGKGPAWGPPAHACCCLFTPRGLEPPTRRRRWRRATCLLVLLRTPSSQSKTATLPGCRRLGQAVLRAGAGQPHRRVCRSGRQPAGAAARRGAGAAGGGAQGADQPCRGGQRAVRGARCVQAGQLGPRAAAVPGGERARGSLAEKCGGRGASRLPAVACLLGVWENSLCCGSVRGSCLLPCCCPILTIPAPRRAQVYAGGSRRTDLLLLLGACHYQVFWQSSQPAHAWARMHASGACGAAGSRAAITDAGA